MQMAVPELMDLSQKTQQTHCIYGLEADWNQTKVLRRQYLTARQLEERGVRFVELTCPGDNEDRWNQHQGLGHTKNCPTVDQPIPALIADLKAHGLFDSTLVIWTEEFSRTRFS